MKKLGIVGVGAIAQSYINVLFKKEFACLHAVADMRQAAVAAAVETAECKGFSSYEEMAESESLDAVIICTPPATHPEIAIFFLRKGIPVLCEKPLAIYEADARAIIEVSKSTNTPVTMASKFRYVEDVIRAKSIIASGLLGKIHLLENAFCSPIDMSSRWNSNTEMSGGGVWIDNGTHSVDIIRYLLGPIARVQLVTNSFSDSIQVEDNAYLLAETVGGHCARADMSWTFDKQLSDYIRIFGTDGTICVGWQGSRYKQANSTGWTEFGKGYDKISTFERKLQNFCAVLDGKEVPLINADDALASVQVVQAAYSSAQTNSWVDVVANSAPAKLKKQSVQLSIA